MILLHCSLLVWLITHLVHCHCPVTVVLPSLLSSWGVALLLVLGRTFPPLHVGFVLVLPSVIVSSPCPCIALSLHCLVLALPCPHVALSPCPPSSRHLALHHLVILPSVILPLCLLLIWPVLSLLISPPLSFLVNILSLLFLLLLVIVLFPFLVIIIVVSSVPPLIWLHLIIVTLWSCLVLVAGSQASVRGIGRGRSEMSHDKGRGSYFITHQWRILPHLPPSPDPPSSKAGHRSRSLWVTCGFTYRNTCRDPDLQVQVTCGYRSLRIWVWNFWLTGTCLDTAIFMGHLILT